MIYGSTSWSETPISTFKLQELNGDELGNILLIDTSFPSTLLVEVDRDASLFIGQNDDFSVNISRELEFEVDINSDQTWSLL